MRDAHGEMFEKEHVKREVVWRWRTGAASTWGRKAVPGVQHPHTSHGGVKRKRADGP